jgi:hypothetical protein
LIDVIASAAKQFSSFFLLGHFLDCFAALAMAILCYTTTLSRFAARVMPV